MRPPIQGSLLALGAAILFGLVSVAAKGATTHALVKGGLAYLLAGLALAPALRGIRIETRDGPAILAMSIVGGAAAPALLFFGLERASAVTTSILLTLEMVFTAILTTIFLRERTRGRAFAGIAVLFLAAVLASLPVGGSGGSTTPLGIVLVAGAAFGWGIDNTISTKLVGSYKPHHLVAIKGLIGGGIALLIAALIGADFTIRATDAARIAFVGLLGIGASIVLFYHALARIGATATSAIFLPASALAGVVGARALLGEAIAWTHVAGAALVILGILLGLPAAPKTR